MAAPKGNTYWKQRLAHGRKHKINTPNQLLQGALDYLGYLKDNPFPEPKLVAHQGEAEIYELPKMRAPTLQGLWVHLGISRDSWYRMKDPGPDGRGKGFPEVCGWVEDTFYDWKFQGAAAGFLNHAIIARDLGLRDRQDITTDDQPIRQVVVSYD